MKGRDKRRRVKLRRADEPGKVRNAECGVRKEIANREVAKETKIPHTLPRVRGMIKET